jgi:anti-anti-sigma factor
MTSRPGAEQLTVEQQGDVSVVHFAHRTILAIDAIEAVGRRLLGLVRDGGARKLVLDFRPVESLTSSMLGTFVAVQRELEAVGGRMVFCNVDPFLQQIFIICNMPPQIVLKPDLPAALAELQSAETSPA